MALQLRCFRAINKLQNICVLSLSSPRMSSMPSDWGSGAGKGGGTGGSIRDAGGAFGRQEAAREEEFFRKQQKDQLEKLKKNLHDQTAHINDMIKEHEKEIERLKKVQKEKEKD